ncbi:MAG: D-aminoacylase [Bacteroidota bacterium]|nr:D-aminoacylase [Bacteroidota bacterium]
MRIVVFLSLSIFLFSCSSDYDLVIKGGTIYDGLGNEAFTANIAVKDGEIVKIGNFRPNAPKIINAEGMIVSPGFIDVHTHIDRGIVTTEGSSVKNYLTQGVSTVVTGNCGSGTWKVDEYFSRLDSIGIGPNVIHLVGHSTLRRMVIGTGDRAPTPEELKKMKTMLASGMEEGALGLSTGLFYVPAFYASTEEIIAITDTLKLYNGIYASHIRDEGSYNIGLYESVKEAIEIGEKTGVQTQISHIKALGTKAWGLSDEVCSLIEDARERGVHVMADQYPYIASHTGLSAAVVPAWVREGGKMKERFADHKLYPKIEAEIRENCKMRGGPESLVIVSYQPNHDFDGLSISEIADIMKKTHVEVIIELLRNASPTVISYNMDPADVEYFMKKDYVMTCSDGHVQFPGTGNPHPRNYGSFPRKIRKYVMEDSLISMEFAIRAATSLPAKMLGLSDRGQISEGYVADIVVFNPETIRDLATFDKPHQYSKGIIYLLVNGQIVIEDEVYNGKLEGKTLRMNNYRK